MPTSPAPVSPRPPRFTGASPFASLVRVLTLRSRRFMTLIKRIVYRLPVLQNVMLPGYRYWVDPGELSAMVGLIDATRGAGGAVVEIGVARGETSVFLLEHLRTTGDPRSLVLVDTFSGFTPESIDHEVVNRRKRASEISDYSYGSARVFNHSLARLGYTNYRIIEGDCSKVDWKEIGPIGAVFLDVDLYVPTAATLDALWPLIVPGGGVVVDDCVEPAWFDGAFQACREFIDRHGLPFVRVGGKGALLMKPAAGC
ncbi:MAG: class I SAM-dependent methyltransferase [Gemmatimonadota bacterium]|nr:class I SAM-dependent methyltransferase [Gemmatimonadota bacterium]